MSALTFLMHHSPAAAPIIAALRLEPLPGEGGFFRQTWRNATASAIYFLLTPDDFSALHRLEQDELWHFYAGDAVDHVQIDPDNGVLHRTRLGSAVLSGEQPQLIVPAGTWQGARLAVGQVSDLPLTTPNETRRVTAPPALSHGFALFGCTLSPAWDEVSFTLGTRADLARAFPDHAELIRRLTR